MERKLFIKTCGLACLGGSTMLTILNGCKSTNYFAQATDSDNKITVRKTEFTYIEKEKTTYRKYVLVKTSSLQFPVCVFRLAENNYTAVLMQCTHAGCELHPAGDYLQCPCHGSEFSNTGEVQSPPADRNLVRYNITTDNENIYIQL